MRITRRRSCADFLVAVAVFSFMICIGALSIPKRADAGSFKVQLEVAVCNSNMVCEEMIGENHQYCPSDCEAPPVIVPTSTDPLPSGSNTGGTQTGAGFGSWASPGNNLNGVLHSPGQAPAIPATTTASPANRTPAKTANKAPAAPEDPSGIDGLIHVAPYIDRAALSFKVFHPSLLTISWGKTQSYELGIIGDSEYRKDFSKELSGLEAGTKYYYRIELLDSLKRVDSYEGGFMTTLSDSKARFPIITDFKVFPGARADELEFSWNMKPGFDSIGRLAENQAAGRDEAVANGKPFARLTRSDFYFPLDPYEGEVVYEGSGNHAGDAGLIEGRRYFYSVFLMDKKGNYSTPAIIAHTHAAIASDGSRAENAGRNGKVYDPLLNDGSSVTVDRNAENQKDADAYPIKCSAAGNAVETGTSEGYKAKFLQNGIEVPFAKGSISADGTKSLFITVDRAGLEEGDIVAACLYSYAAESWNYYILSKNPDGSRTLIFPELSSELSGKIHYQFALSVLKYKGQIENIKSGEIDFEMPKNETGFSGILLKFGPIGIAFLLALFKWIRPLFL